MTGSRAQLFGQIAIVVAPVVATTTWLVLRSDLIAPMRWTLLVGVNLWWIGVGLSVVSRVERPLNTLAGLVRGLREGDYSTRARVSGAGPLAEALRATNELADLLDRHRLEVVDATTLVRRIMNEVDVAVIGVDAAGRVQHDNVVARRVLGVDELTGRTTEELGIEAWMEGPCPRIIEIDAVIARRWQLGRAQLRQAGEPFTLLVLSDLSRVLDDEARSAAFKTVRVLSHEVNNTLAPIVSVAEALAERYEHLEPTLHTRLRRIAEGAGNLVQFMQAFSELAGLPKPARQRLDVSEWVHRAAAAEPRLAVQVAEGPAVVLSGDPAQLDRALVNLVKNAVDASLADDAEVSIGWTLAGDWVEIVVLDTGPGLLDGGNLFVPFYTTKPEGSGIGLALSREIARGHGGDLRLDNRKDCTGCVARLTLPVSTT